MRCSQSAGVWSLFLVSALFSTYWCLISAAGECVVLSLLVFDLSVAGECVVLNLLVFDLCCW